MRTQSDIVASMILVAIIIAAISAAYLWGLPLFTKSGDVTRLRYVQDTFDRIGNDVLAIAREGGQRTMEVRLETGRVILERDQTGEYVLTYLTNTPVSFFPAQGAPVNDWNSPYQEKTETINFTGSASYPANCTGVVKTANQTIDNTAYSFYACDAIGNDGIYDCFFKSPQGQDPTGDCITPGGVVTPTFRLDYLASDGSAASLIDGLETAVGLLGQDKPGVVIGKAEKVGRMYETTLTLKMRKIFDPTKSELVQIELTPKAGGTATASGVLSITLKNAGERVEIRGDTIYRIVTIEVDFR